VSDSDVRPSPLEGIHQAGGATLIPTLGIARHYGNPAEEYGAALESSVVVDRSDGFRLEVSGRAPGQMLSGIITGRLPQAPQLVEAGLRRGTGSYSAVLTPKGKMVTDLRVFSTGDTDEVLLLDVPRAGGAGLLDHLRKFMPPRLARVADHSKMTGMITLIGPAAAVSLDKFLADRTEARSATSTQLAGSLAGGQAHEYALVAADKGDLLMARSTSLAPLTVIDLVGDAEVLTSAWQFLTSHGVVPAGTGVFETLRVEAGTPAFGADMNPDTLLPEAGIENIAIDPTKGCYTGQEVIVRIRDRGHVNRHLRGLVFGDGATPAAGTELFQAGQDRPMGTVTSAVNSPRFGGVIGLGYVRRHVEPPADLHLGDGDGELVGVRALTPGEWWAKMD
jgi:aminomethyltransferase